MLTGIGSELGLAGGLGAIGAAGTTSASSAASTAATAAATAGKTGLGIKIAAVAAAAVVAGSTAFGISQMDKEDEDERISRHHVAVVEYDEESSADQIESALNYEDDSGEYIDDDSGQLLSE